jgi:hypothetical protein
MKQVTRKAAKMSVKSLSDLVRHEEVRMRPYTRRTHEEPFLSFTSLQEAMPYLTSLW